MASWPAMTPRSSAASADVARERADLVQAGAVGDEAVAADAAVGGLQADDAAERGRLADGAAGVAAEGRRSQAGGHGRGRAAGGAARDAARVPGVAGEAGGARLGRRAHRELVHVGLAEQDRAGGLQPSDGRRGVGRPVAGQDPRGARRVARERAEVVLERHGHARERGGPLAGRDRRVEGAGAGQRLGLPDLVVGVKRRIQRGDALRGRPARPPRSRPRARRSRRGAGALKARRSGPWLASCLREPWAP